MEKKEQTDGEERADRWRRMNRMMGNENQKYNRREQTATHKHMELIAMETNHNPEGLRGVRSTRACNRTAGITLMPPGSVRRGGGTFETPEIRKPTKLLFFCAKESRSPTGTRLEADQKKSSALGTDLCNEDK
ncbi:uncharacterized [Tachysurus ichikawai]